MSRYNYGLLPTELWLSIIRWATISRSTFAVSTFEPFLAFFERNEEDAQALTVKYTVVQVCRLWRDLALGILYEDIRVRHGAHALAEVLGKTHEDRQLGKCVRRLELPYYHTGTATQQSSDLALQILQSCADLETLVRPFMQGPSDEVRFEFPIRSHYFPNLRRLEWWHYNHATRSGGINSLMDVLRYSPNIQYLTIGGDLWINSTNSILLRLPVLTTLRIQRVNFLFIREICQWQLPSLAHVIVEAPLEIALEAIWEAFGSRLCTVEFGRHLGFLLTDQITLFLRGCPQAKALHYFIYFTSVPPVFNQPCALQCICLHSHPSHMFSDSEQLPRQHFSFLSQSSFPALRRIILYGDWTNITPEPYFKDFVKIMNSRGCLVEHSHM